MELLMKILTASLALLTLSATGAIAQMNHNMDHSDMPMAA
jgi:hypothetical protein